MRVLDAPGAGLGGAQHGQPLQDRPQVAQAPGRLPGGGALLGGFGQEVLQDRPQRRGQVQPGRRGAQVPLGHGEVGAGAGEGRAPGQELVEHDPGGVHVARGAAGAGADELGRHVVGRAGDGGGEARGVLQQPRHAEVAQLEAALAVLAPPGAQEHVVRLDVAVQHALAVGVVQGLQDERGGGGRPGGLQRPVLPQDPPQGSALQVVHDDGQILAVDDEIDHGHNARMPQTQQDCAFSHKPVDDGVVLQVLRPQELGRHAPAAAALGPQPHLAGRPAPQQGGERVAGAEGPGARALCALIHRRPIHVRLGVMPTTLCHRRAPPSGGVAHTCGAGITRTPVRAPRTAV